MIYFNIYRSELHQWCQFCRQDNSLPSVPACPRNPVIWEFFDDDAHCHGNLWFDRSWWPGKWQDDDKAKEDIDDIDGIDGIEDNDNQVDLASGKMMTRRKKTGSFGVHADDTFLLHWYTTGKPNLIATVVINHDFETLMAMIYFEKSYFVSSSWLGAKFPLCANLCSQYDQYHWSWDCSLPQIFVKA